MTAPDPRLDEIQARANNPFAADNTLKQADADRDYLLAELRKAHEALERVWDEATMAIKSTIGAYSEGGVWAFEQAEKRNPNPYRAAVAAAKGDGQ